MDELLTYGDLAITRPPRAQYDPTKLPNEIEVENYGKIRREPVRFVNNRGLTIVGSYYSPKDPQETPCCLIYLHGNSSCQLEGTYLVPLFATHGISTLCIDFSGCGRSTGKRISLGYLEKDDVACAITYLQVHYNIQKVALWGRSMGGACTFYSMTYEQEICGAVADSPFASLPVLVKDLSGVPRCFTGITLRLLANRILQSSGFDVRECLPVDEARKSTVPVFIIHGEKDDFIDVKHSRQLYAEYKGETKVLKVVPGQDHNSDRPREVTAEAIVFLARCFGKEVSVDEILAQIAAKICKGFDFEQVCNYSLPED